MPLDEGALRAGYRLNRFETLRSTSDEALGRAAKGDRGRLWIVADMQSGGRGRQGRPWASPPGNVYASLLLVDAVPPALAAQLGFVAGVAAVRALAAVAADCRVELKWPNDLLVDGAKLGGILVEGSRTPQGAFACVVGVGINVASSPAEAPYPVTHLHAVSAERPGAEKVVTALTGAMDHALGTWDSARGFDRIRDLWLGHALPPGTPLTVSIGVGLRQAGRFVSMDERGRLVLATDREHLRIEAGDVLLSGRPDVKAEGGGVG